MPRRNRRHVLMAVAGLMAIAGLLVAGNALTPTTATSQPGGEASAADAAIAQLFFLNIRGQVVLADPDGSNVRIIHDELGTAPDGIAVDAENGHIYWSNMGASKEEDGSVMRSGLDGDNVVAVVPSGGTFTAKQLTLDEDNGVLYWSDREGMRVQRVNVDGTGLETLVTIAEGEDARLIPANWAVGIAVDVEGGHVYWTQKGGPSEGVGRIFRAGIDIPEGQTAADRQDIEVLFADLPEPIDLALDLETREIYWTDRGDPPRGNTVNRAPMDPPAGVDPATRDDIEILVDGLNEAIGISLDLERDRMYFTDLGGSLYGARLDGSDFATLGTGLGTLTGIAFAEVPLLVTE